MAFFGILNPQKSIQMAKEKEKEAPKKEKVKAPAPVVVKEMRFRVDLDKDFDRMLAISIGTAILSACIGITLSFHLDSAPAPTIVVAMTVLFISAFLFAPKHGILRRQNEEARSA